VGSYYGLGPCGNAIMTKNDPMREQLGDTPFDTIREYPTGHDPTNHAACRRSPA
jgi:hypothetical protein